MRTYFFRPLSAVACALLIAGQIARAEVDRAALDKALTELPTLEYGKPYAAFDVLRMAVNDAASNPELRTQLEQKLITILQSNPTRAAKDIVCRNLGMVGSQTCVPAVAPLLTDPQFSHMARYCLENLSNPAADAALRQALSRTSGELKAGVIGSLGARQDPQAVPLLIPALNDPSLKTIEAAIFALGRIGTVDAANALTATIMNGPVPSRDAAAQACLAAADKLRRNGDLKRASAIFQDFYSNRLKLEHPERYQPAGLTGLVLTESESEQRFLLPALAGTNAILQQTAAALASMPSIKLEPLLVAMPTLPPSGQIALLGALLSRVEPEIKPAILPLLESPNTDVRAAALSVLASRANALDIPRLARLAAAQTGTTQQMARQSLITLPGSDINAALIHCLGNAEPVIRVELIQSLAARTAREAAPAVASQLQESQSTLRLAALEALGTLADDSQLPAMIGLLLKSPSEEEQSAAAAAIRTVCERCREKALPSVLSGLAQADETLKPQFYGFLGAIGGTRALEQIRDAAKNTNSPLREAAVRVLVKWPGLEAAPDLQALMQNTERDLFRKLAFRAYVRLARESEMAEPERIRLIATAADAARTIEERRLILGSLAELSSLDALKLAERFIKDPEAAPEACLAALGIISRFDAGKKEQAEPVLRQIIKSATTPALQESARKQMSRLGIIE